MSEPCGKVSVQDWVKDALVSRGIVDASSQDLVTIKIEPLSDNRGLDAIMNRVQVNFPDGKAPVHLMLKMTLDEAEARAVVTRGGRWREAVFYIEREKLVPAEYIPEVVKATFSVEQGEYKVLMKDVTRTPINGQENFEVIPVNMVFGNQIWGSKYRSFSEEEQKTLLKSIFNAAAQVHAAHWKDPRILEMRWLKGVDWFHGEGRESWERSMNVGVTAWEGAKARFLGANSSDPSFIMSEKLVSIIDRSFASASWQALQDFLQNPSTQWTFCHGDFHSSNMFAILNGSSGEEIVEGSVAGVKWFDWTEVGPWEPTADLGQLLISDVKPSLVARFSKELVTSYWKQLVSLGVSASEYPFDICWDRFCQGPVERWIWMFALLTSFTALPGSALQYFHDQLLAFIEAHGDYPVYQLKPLVCF
jgi:hypothetical protein